MLKGGITPKGTVFIREFDAAKNLIRKRVLKRHQQFDTCFVKKDNKIKWAQTLHTNWVNNTQILKTAPQKLNWFHRIFLKPPKELITQNSKGEKLLVLPDCDMDLIFNGKNGISRGEFIQKLTGFAQESTNTLCKELKQKALKMIYGG